MSQVKKEEVRELIIATGRKEFLKLGFISTSMRIIADTAFISKSSIYTYYSSKDHLFREIVKETINEINHIFSEMQSPHESDLENNTLEYHLDKVDDIADFIEKHRDNLFLLMFRSEGSSLDNYVETVIELYSDSCEKAYDKWVEVLHFSNPVISRFFIHNLASSYINFIREILMHHVPRAKIIEYGKEFMLYTFKGTEALFGF